MFPQVERAPRAWEVSGGYLESGYDNRRVIAARLPSPFLKGDSISG